MSTVLPRGRSIRRHQDPVALPDSGQCPTSPTWDPVAVTIHDLRTPLSVISMAAEVLQSNARQRGMEEEEILLQRIRRNTSWLTILVDNLAAEIELSTNALSLDWETVDLAECLDTSLAITQSLFEQRHQRVHWEGTAAAVWGDRLRIQQGIINLLLNAGKYGDPHSEIRVEVAPGDPWTSVYIRNFGPIIPVREQTHIFERFVRGSNAQQANPTGLGLGLHIVKTIVERHGGQVGVESTPENGTVFWLTLPSSG